MPRMALSAQQSHVPLPHPHGTSLGKAVQSEGKPSSPTSKTGKSPVCGQLKGRTFLMTLSKRELAWLGKQLCFHHSQTSGQPPGAAFAYDDG